VSIFDIDEKRKNIKQLDSNINVDILIIGGGMTGLTSAYFLKDKKNICVVDANLIGHGVTLNSTAKINYFQQVIYSNIIKSTKYSNALEYLNSQKYAMELLKNIIETENINCDFEQVPSYVFASSEKEVDILKKEVDFLRKNNVNVIKKSLPASIKSFSSYCVNDTYIFNPIKYLKFLYDLLNKKNISVYENTKIINIKRINDKYECYGEKYKIIANKVIIACHYPFFILPFLMPLRCSIEKSYIIVSKAKTYEKFTCINTNNPTFSLRYYKNNNNIYRINLAKSHDLSSTKNDKYYFNKVKKIFNINDKDIIMKYTNSDVMTPDYLPYIGVLKKDLYIGVGYNTWGMTNSILAAKLITDNILNIENKFKNIFNPNRKNIQTLLKLPMYIFNNTKSYVNTKLIKNKNWYSNGVCFYKNDGKNLASYIDENGVEHIVYNKCPHLGCSLIFNEVEKTWDCPCHSSRFDINGKCIKGPSVYDITYKKN